MAADQCGPDAIMDRAGCTAMRTMHGNSIPDPRVGERETMTRQAKIPGGVERRRYKRYRVKEGALAFLGAVPGSISDISEGGLAVHYVVFEKQPEEDLQLDIFFGRDDFYLADLPGRKVSDADSSPDVTFSRIRVRRMGVQFGELTGEQKSRLKYFILHNTLGDA